MPSVILAGTTTGTALSLTSDTSGELQIRTNNGSTTAMTLTTAGNVGVGTTTPQSRLDVSLNITTGAGVAGTGTVANFNGVDAAAATVYLNGYGSTNGTQFIGRVAAGTAASPTAIQLNTSMMRILGVGYNGSAFTGSRTEISMRAAENWTTTANGTYIAFNTTANTTTSVSERMRIDDAGNVGIGTSSPNTTAANRVVLEVNGTTSALLNISGGGARRATFYADSTDCVFGSITSIPLEFLTGGVERMRIDSSGNLLVGTTTTAGPGTAALVAGKHYTQAQTLSIANNSATAIVTLSEGNFITVSAYVDTNMYASAHVLCRSGAIVVTYINQDANGFCGFSGSGQSLRVTNTGTGGSRTANVNYIQIC